jgi:hypothetical protein
MAHSSLAPLVIGIVLFSLAAPLAATPTPAVAPTPVAAVPVCNGKYKGGLKPSSDELAEILKKHADWVKDGGLVFSKLADDPRRANLCGANLERAPLSPLHG